MTTIVTDPDIRSGAPRIEGTRITVSDIKRRVIDRDDDPFAVASEYDIDVAAVFRALAYYYENVEQIRERETKQARSLEDSRQESANLRKRAEEQGLAEGQ